MQCCSRLRAPLFWHDYRHYSRITMYQTRSLYLLLRLCHRSLLFPGAKIIMSWTVVCAQAFPLAGWQHLEQKPHHVCLRVEKSRVHHRAQPRGRGVVRRVSCRRIPARGCGAARTVGRQQELERPSKAPDWRCARRKTSCCCCCKRSTVA